MISYVGVAHPWMCDVMGHLNVRHYAAMFDDASFHLLGRVADPLEDAAGAKGWADVRCEIDFKAETLSGTLLTIRSHVEKVGTSSMTYVHVMTGTLDGLVHAQARIVSVRFDLAARQKLALDQIARARAETLISPPPAT